MAVHNHPLDRECHEQLIGECILSPSSESVVEAAQLIKKAQAIKNSVWYRMARRSLSEGERPTLSIVLALVDQLAIYSADAGSSPERGR